MSGDQPKQIRAITARGRRHKSDRDPGGHLANNPQPHHRCGFLSARVSCFQPRAQWARGRGSPVAVETRNGKHAKVVITNFSFGGFAWLGGSCVPPQRMGMGAADRLRSRVLPKLHAYAPPGTDVASGQLHLPRHLAVLVFFFVTLLVRLLSPGSASLKPLYLFSGINL
jgi:hypothetical protein